MKIFARFIVLAVYFVVNIQLTQAAVSGVQIQGEKSITLPSSKKVVKLQSLNLNEDYKNKVIKKLTKLKKKALYNYKANLQISNKNKISNKRLKHFQVDLGMANVPVLDQGPHGTCATFATTAAIDAYKYSGDYISQQCLLEIGNYEEEKSFGDISSGWDGALYSEILDRINKYGIIDKQTCPHEYASPEYKLSPNEYHQYSFNQWAHDFKWRVLTTPDEDSILETASIDQVKESLNNGNRVLIGTILILKFADGVPIANYHNGLWDFPKNYNIKDFINDVKHLNFGGHAVIITGYDDKLKLFKIRNSWGEEQGDHGEFYMSYDYFEAMNIDSIELY